MPEMRIGNQIISPESDAWIIAEIGHNHGGNLETALQMCKVAKECGCDAVKFQKRTNKRLYTKKFLQTPYNSEHAFGATYGEHREALEFGRSEYRELFIYCYEIGIVCFATAFDEEAADFLETFDPPVYKIASGDLTNPSLIGHVAKLGKPMIVSTAGGTPADIGRIDRLLAKTQAAFLHCVALYPCPAEKVNLSRIDDMRFNMPHRVIGYSCHYNGIAMAEAAYIHGARIIEKHFTLDHTSKGSDHAISLEPNGMRRLVRDLRRMKEAMGQGISKIRDLEEDKGLAKMEKSLWPTGPIPAGRILSNGDIVSKSPAIPGAMLPYRKSDLLGKVLVNDCSTAAPYFPADIFGEEE